MSNLAIVVFEGRHMANEAATALECAIFSMQPVSESSAQDLSDVCATTVANPAIVLS